MTPLYLIGLDLGQLKDPTALVIAQRRIERWGNIQEQHYLIRYLERFPLGTPYGGRCLHGAVPKFPCRECPRGVSIGGIVEQVREHLRHLPVPDGWYHNVPAVADGLVTFPRQELPYEWIIDYTGVGRSVADMFTSREDWPICVTITSGNAVTEPERGIWHVSKRQLISPLQVALQTRRLHVVNNELGRILMQEGTNFRYRLSKTSDGDEQYGTWRQGEHDDVLLATALVTWWGERTAPMFLGSDTEAHQYAVATGNPLFPREVA